MSEVSEVYAVLVTHPDGTENIPAMIGPREDGKISTIPIVGTDRDHMLRLWPSVKEDLVKHFCGVRFVRFTNLEVIEEAKREENPMQHVP